LSSSTAVVASFIATSPHIRPPVGLCSNSAQRSASEERYQYLLHDRDSIATTLPKSQCDLRIWVTHYNAGRPHIALGAGVPDPPPVEGDYS